ncbi:MAG: hypothetical protein N3B13_06470 [Deltaproteobacteria bacterium]|nr:hypothetical protein [Deltaproteobacteria bacterium]
MKFSMSLPARSSFLFFIFVVFSCSDNENHLKQITDVRKDAIVMHEDSEMTDDTAEKTDTENGADVVVNDAEGSDLSVIDEINAGDTDDDAQDLDIKISDVYEDGDVYYDIIVFYNLKCFNSYIRYKVPIQYK